MATIRGFRRYLGHRYPKALLLRIVLWPILAFAFEFIWIFAAKRICRLHLKEVQEEDFQSLNLGK